jgi:hypothetical protein
MTKRFASIAAVTVALLGFAVANVQAHAQAPTPTVAQAPSATPSPTGSMMP